MRGEENFQAIVGNISLLYELSLSAGKSLDLFKNCDEFLKTLMTRKNLGFSSVWIRSEHLPERKEKNAAVLVYARPEYRARDSLVPLTHPVFSLLGDDGFFSASPSDDHFARLIMESGISRGAYAVFRLQELGFLKLFSFTKSVPFSRKEMNQLKNVIDKFAVSLKACLLHKRLISEMQEKRQLEEELQKAQKLESIGLLAGGIAHDFNNIMTAIVTNVALASIDIPKDSQAAEFLKDAEKGVLQAKALTSELLTFSKGGMPVKKLVFFSDFIRQSSSFFLRGTNIRCDMNLPDDIWPVEIDEGQISQVLNNLIINAEQAMPGGGVIRIKAENVVIGQKRSVPLQEGKYVKISIEDQGAGIPQDLLPKIFDPYFTTKPKGSGLGLSITYSIIKKHEGYITVSSKVGEGTVFTIYLPASEKNVPSAKLPEEHLMTGSGRILVMDDEEAILRSLKKILSRLGYTVETAKSGEEAAELYGERLRSGCRFDLVILDLTVPGGMGGTETLKALRTIDPGVRALVCSGYSNDPIMSQYRGFGFCGVVTKPCIIQDLSRAISAAMSQRAE